MKKVLSLILACFMLISVVGCTPKDDESDLSSTSSSGPAEDKFLTGPKPELNILTWYQPWDYHQQPSYKIVEEITGYKIKWFNLPQENASEKLMLEMAGGTSYDLITRLTIDQGGMLNAKNVIVPVNKYLDKYGDNIKTAVSKTAWNAVTNADGTYYAIPQEDFSGPQPGGDPYGILKGGIGFRSDALESLNMQLPTTLEEFYNVCAAFTKKTGKPAFTASKGGWNVAIMSAFGMGDPIWYSVDGKLTHRIKHPGIVPYIEFMQKLYKEKILDNDMPTLAVTDARTKFTGGNALCTGLYFWDLPGIVNALNKSNPKAKALFVPYLAPSATQKADVYVKQGLSGLNVIPKTSKNPEHAIIWYNILSDVENFRKIYIGEEGKSYEIKNNQYHPIFPAFNDFVNADKFTGAVESSKVFQMWQARARKTPEMAEAYDAMNSKISNYNVKSYYESYAASIPAVQQNQLSIETMINDEVLKVIANGSDAKKAVDNIIKKWETMNGKEYEAAMQDWFSKNKSLYEK